MLHQRISAASIGKAELLAAFSYALDITEGQPEGHSMRSCWIGMQVGKAIGLSDQELGNLYYTVLLKDLGCSSNSARICELYAADDRAFKQGYKTAGTSLAATLHFVFSKTAKGRRWTERAGAIGNILVNGSAIADELILSRCTRGADVARMLGFSDAVCSGIYHLDEHWDGSGRPDELRGDRIPVASQIALLAQVADVFHTHAGTSASFDEVRRRAGGWLDPRLARAFDRIASRPEFWSSLRSPALPALVAASAPVEEAVVLDDDYLDAVVAAFGQVIDAKSPFTSGHSARVADLAYALAGRSGFDLERAKTLRRAAFLHDVGKLGVSSTVLEKPAPLSDREWIEMRGHAEHTRRILGRIGALESIADIAAAHHERLDGRGYPRRLSDADIAQETRIITTCDFYDALASERPYRAAMPTEEALAIMAREVGAAIDPTCFELLRAELTSRGD